MSIKIVGCKDKNLRPYIQRAVEFYALQLLSPRMRQVVEITVKFKEDIDNLGSAEVVAYNKSKKPRKFLIEIDPHIGASTIFKTLAHEMVHIRQFAYGHIDATLSRWHYQKIDSVQLNYWDHPWEIEAHGMEAGLVTKFATQEVLWEVFADFRDPTKKSKRLKIKWKIDP